MASQTFPVKVSTTSKGKSSQTNGLTVSDTINNPTLNQTVFYSLTFEGRVHHPALNLTQTATSLARKPTCISTASIVSSYRDLKRADILSQVRPQKEEEGFISVHFVILQDTNQSCPSFQGLESSKHQTKPSQRTRKGKRKI